MFKKAVWLMLVVSLALIGSALAQPMGPMGKGPGRPGPGMNQGMRPNGMGMGRGRHMGRPGGPGSMAIWKDKELMKKAGISEDQANKIREMHFQNQKDRIKIGSDLKLKQLEMAELMDADKPDEGKIMAKAKEISALREKMFLSGVEQGLTMKKLITPEQEEKLRDAMQEKHSELAPPPDPMFGMGPEMMPPGPDMNSPEPTLPEAPEPEGLF